MNHTSKTLDTTELLNKFNMLSQQEQQEAFEFVEFLAQKKKGKNVRAHPKAGFLKGVFTMSKDFDEPLEDFREYME